MKTAEGCTEILCYVHTTSPAMMHAFPWTPGSPLTHHIEAKSDLPNRGNSVLKKVPLDKLNSANHTIGNPYTEVT